MKTYSKLKFIIKDPEGEKSSYTIKENVWDLSMEDFYNICRQMSFAVGYSPDLVKEFFDEE